MNDGGGFFCFFFVMACNGMVKIYIFLGRFIIKILIMNISCTWIHLKMNFKKKYSCAFVFVGKQFKFQSNFNLPSEETYLLLKQINDICSLGQPCRKYCTPKAELNYRCWQ